MDDTYNPKSFSGDALSNPSVLDFFAFKNKLYGYKDIQDQFTAVDNTVYPHQVFMENTLSAVSGIVDFLSSSILPPISPMYSEKLCVDFYSLAGALNYYLPWILSLSSSGIIPIPPYPGSSTTSIDWDLLLNTFLPLSGGTVSNYINLHQGDFTILSGNYIQSNSDNVENYSSKNSFIQAEEAKNSRQISYGTAYTGTKGYCILSVYEDENLLKLSGNIDALEQLLNNEYDGVKPEASRALNNLFTGNPQRSYELKNVLFSFSLAENQGVAAFKIIEIIENNSEYGIVKVDSLPLELIQAAAPLASEEDYIDLYLNDDNGIYVNGYPEIGNAILENFYAQHIEGGSTRAIGKYAHAEGRDNVADVRYSHAEGSHNVAGGMASHAEGFYSIAIGRNSHVEGRNGKAIGEASHAEGILTKSYNVGSHAEGNESTANGNYSHAEGSGTITTGESSHAEGNGSSANGNYSHAEGQNTKAESNSAHAEGINTLAGSGNRPSASSILSTGYFSHAEGNGTWANGNSSHAEGLHTRATGNSSHSEGQETTASGVCSHVEGYNSIASGSQAHAEGYGTNATSFRAHAEGANTTASNEDAHAEGNGTTASGKRSHAEGYATTSIKDNSHAEGYLSKARNNNSHAEGYSTYADGTASHAEGNQTKAFGNNSHAEGTITSSIGLNSHAEGNGQRSNSSFTISGTANATTYTTSQNHGLSVNDVVFYENVFAKVTNVPSTTQFEVNVTLSSQEISNKNITIVKGYAYGDNSHSEGYYNKAVGLNSHAEGSTTLASGPNSHTEGEITTASGTDSHAEGYGTKATSFRAHAEGANTTASNEDTHAEGLATTASGKRAHAEGYGSTAEGDNSHAEGFYTKAIGVTSHADGYYTEAAKNYSHASGIYSKANHVNSFVWNGDSTKYSQNSKYTSKKDGSFNINPIDGINGFYIGDQNLSTIISEYSSDFNISSLSDYTQLSVTNQISSYIVNNYTTLEITNEISSKFNTLSNYVLISDNQKLSNKVSVIQSLIPESASNSNQLADKKFVTDIFSEGTNFKGAFDTYAVLTSQPWQITDQSLTSFVANNDYTIVLSDENHLCACTRYTYVSSDNTPNTNWEYAFTINDKPFTESQWNAINSEATKEKINEISNKANLSDVNNGMLTIQKNGSTVATFTANASSNLTANITVPLSVSQLENDAGYLTQHQSLSAYATSAQITEGWWSEWTFSDGGTHMLQGPFEEHDEYFYTVPNDGGSVGTSQIFATEQEAIAASSLTFESFTPALTATRHRVAAPIPVKTSDLINDTSMISVTWSQLKNLKDNSNLIPGTQYRITDYVATTNGDMRSCPANHPFDIIVIADAVNKLNEKARAIRHSGDTYFPEATKFEAWQVWYCIDNDIDRFAWADTNGNGVIYRLIDEFSNDVPYDFKGLQFRPYGDVIDVETMNNLPATGVEGKIYYIISAGETYKWNPDWDTNGNGVVDEGEQKYIATADTTFRYTFDSGSSTNNTDYSLSGWNNNVFGNKINPYFVPQRKLNSIVFKGYYCYSNIFGNICYSNTFGNDCYSNTFGNNCFSNTFGNDCYSNTFENYCSFNTFGNYYHSNTFENNCYSNTFGNYCHSNTFGNYCSFNTFGNYYHSNTFENYYDSNTFGNYCSYNTFGNYCHSNTFGNYCSYNTFGNYCNSNTFKNGDNLKNYVQFVEFESGNCGITLNLTGSSSNSTPYRNVTVLGGVNNSGTKTITDSTPGGQTFHTTFKPANSQEISI